MPSELHPTEPKPKTDKKLFRLFASRVGQVLFDDRVETESPREAREQMKNLLGLQSLTGVVYAIMDLGDLNAEQELVALLRFKEGFWTSCAGQARCDLVERVMQTVYDATETWRDDGLGADLAYLAWAISAGTSVLWHSDCATHRLF